MPLFTKKPVTIEARQMTSEDNFTLATWCGGFYKVSLGVIEIPTLEGVMAAQPGDWIIKGIKGEFYPCKPDIFEGSYDPAPE